MRAPLILLLFAAPAIADVDIQKSSLDPSALVLDVTTDVDRANPDFTVTIDGQPVIPAKVTQHPGGFTIEVAAAQLPADGKSHDVVVAVGNDASKPDSVAMPATKIDRSYLEHPPAAVDVRGPLGGALPESPPLKRFELAAGGFIQPQFRLRQSAPGVQPALDGFRLSRAHGMLTGDYHFDAHTDAYGYMEAQLTGSSFQLLDAYLALRGDFPMDPRAGWRIRLGQQYTPFSRQTFLSDVEEQLPEKAQLTQQPTTTDSVVPWRQLGLSITANVPKLPWVELSVGAFNGKGINLVDNIDSNLMYVGRLAIRPFAPRAPITEGPFGPDQLSIAVDGAISKQDLGMDTETHKWIGLDGFFSWRGLSGTAEWVKARHEHTMAGQTSFGQQGLNLQLGYLLPFLGKHLEISGRVEEIDRNDTVPITKPGDANQSSRLWWICVTWYQLQHNLKLQLAGVHVDEVENQTSAGMNATYPNDFILLQATVRYL